MTIQDLGSIGELIAAVATVLTLIYLAIQIRANTRATLLESYRSRSAAGEAGVLMLADNSELAGVFNKGLDDFYSLDGVELTRFLMIVSNLVNQIQLVFTETQIGGDPADLKTIVRGADFLRAPGGRQYWREHNNYFNSDFVQWISRKLDLETEPAAQQSAAADSARAD